ncbi:MAG TPA: hypothetical protein VFG50_03105 [Rhodothermales bacterium]|nr:hypothetical protein [Rhodothermales bacterium]
MDTFWTPDRLLVAAVVMTLLAADGIYRSWKQRQEEQIGPKLFVFYTGTLTLGSGLTWFGFLLQWLK